MDNRYFENEDLFYERVIRILSRADIDFLVGGGYALRSYTFISKPNKDLDIFCMPGDFMPILHLFKENGFRVEMTDSRWLAKILCGPNWVDVIFNASNNICRVTDQWFMNSRKGELFGHPVSLVAPEEMIWCKLYVQNRERYDGSDINHLLLKCGSTINWERLMSLVAGHWQLLMSQLLNFLWVYPSRKDTIPEWLWEDLLQKAEKVMEFSESTQNLCLGPLIDQTNYEDDIKRWGFKSITIKSV